MKTKRRTLIVLLVFVLAAGAALALLTHANQKAEQAASEAEDGSIPLLDVTTATLESVSIQYGGETLTLRPADDGWTLTEDPAYHLDDSACNTIRTAMCKELSSTWIATCDQVVMDYAASAGLKAVMTADTHVRCTTRTAEAMLKIEEMTGQRADIVVMVQGDEPMITPDMIDAAVEPMLKDPSINVVNLMADLATEEEFEDPNEVKVVTDLNGDALYFSREPIPSRRKGTPHVPMHKQVCIIPFRRDYLLKFNAMDECPLEIIESVDMMRILEHGEKVRMVPTDKRTLSVDTQEDLERVREMMRDDALRISYTK